GARWVVEKVGGESRSPKESLYWTIIRVLEDGTLSRLRVCDECQRFFAAKDLRQKFCSRECSNIDERRGAKDRVARWRDRKRKEQQRQAKEAVKKKIIGRLSEFLKATENGELSPKHGDLLKALGEGNKLKGWGIVRKLQSKLEAG